MIKGWFQPAIVLMVLITLSIPFHANSLFRADDTAFEDRRAITFHSTMDIPDQLIMGTSIDLIKDMENLILGPLMIDILDDDATSLLPAGGFREGQFIVQTNGPPDMEVLFHFDGIKFLDILSWNTFLVESTIRDLETLVEKYNEIRAIFPYHSSMVLDGSLFHVLSSTSDDEIPFDVVIGTYSHLGIDNAREISLLSRRPLGRIDAFTYFTSMTRDGVARVASMPVVSHISPLLAEESDNDIAADIIDVKETWSTMGLNGSGQTIAVADTGLDTGSNSTMHQDIKGRIVAAYAYGRSGNWSDPDIHVWDSSTSSWSYKGGHGTHVIGSALGDGSASSGKYSGMSPAADLVIQSTMTGSGSLSIPAYSRLFGDAYNSGARIHTNSWSSRSSYGNYSWRSWQIDNYIWGHKDLLVLFSAGNKGSLGQYSISTQSSSKNVISVGASENYRPTISSSANNISQMASFSSQGYTWGDGRIKPDVVAPGTYVLSTRASTITDFWNHYWGTNTTYVGVNSKYAYLGGTSMSTPLVAGMSGLIRQYFEENESIDDPSAALIKASVINGARPLDGDWSSIPNRYEGWGRVNLSNSLATNESDAGNLFFEDNATGLTTGSYHYRKIPISGKGADLIMTLVWSDHPGSNTSSTKLVNDLDLIVTSPNGSIFYGNDLVHPYNSTNDRKNNVERIRIPKATAGLYNITVKAFSVIKGPQPYAIVVTGDLTQATATVGFVKEFTPSNGTSVGIFLSDSNLTDDGSVRVTINSTTDPTGESVVLNEILDGSKGTGIFHGSINILNNTPGSGDVQVSGDELVFVHYDEFYPSRTISSSVMALEVPDIFNVTYSSVAPILTYKDELILTLNGTKGMTVTFDVISLIEGMGIPSNDQGTDPDEIANDGIYTGHITIPDMVKGNFTLEGHIYRPHLDGVSFRSNELVRINTDIPVKPQNLTIGPLPEGNSLQLNWESLYDPDIISYSIFRANETYPGSGVPDEMVRVNITSDNRTSYIDRGLTDGQIYFYSISSLNLLGYTSSLSDAAHGIPFDLDPPWIEWNGPGNGDVLFGVVELNISLEEDTGYFLLQGSPDPDGDGYPDHLWTDLAKYDPIPTIIEWDTTELDPNIWEGRPILLRIKAFDEMMNRNSTAVLTSIFIDNTPPDRLILDSSPTIIINISIYHLSGKTEPGAYVQVLDEGTVRLEVQAEPNGEFSAYIQLESGVNEFQVQVFDTWGNGPLIGDDLLYIVFDDIDPVPVIEWSDNITSRSVRLTGEGSFDPGPISPLSGISEYFWKITFADDEWTFGYMDPILDLKIPGIYDVSLMVTDHAGNQVLKERQMRVVDGIDPKIIPFKDISMDEDEEVEIVPLVTDDDLEIQLSGKYNWLIEGPRTYRSSERILRTIFDTPGIYLAHLTVTDTGGNSASNSFSIKVNDTTPPLANAGLDRTVIRGRIVTISAEGTMDNYPNGSHQLVYEWDIESLDLQGNEVEFTFLVHLLGEFNVILRVTDDNGNVGSDEMTMKVISDGISPYLILADPENGATNTTMEGSIVLMFSEPMDIGTVWNGVMVKDHLGLHMNKDVEWSDDMTTLTVYVDGFERGQRYTIELLPGLTDLSGEPIQYISISFTVRDELKVLEARRTSGQDLYVDNVINDLPTTIDLKFTTDLEGDQFVEIIGPSAGKAILIPLILKGDGHYLIAIPEGLQDGVYSISISDLVSADGESLSGEGQLSFVLDMDQGGSSDGNNIGSSLFLVTIIILALLFPLTIGLISVVIFIRNKKKVNMGMSSSIDERSQDVDPRPHNADPVGVSFYSGTGNDK